MEWKYFVNRQKWFFRTRRLCGLREDRDIGPLTSYKYIFILFIFISSLAREIPNYDWTEEKGLMLFECITLKIDSVPLIRKWSWSFEVFVSVKQYSVVKPLAIETTVYCAICYIEAQTLSTENNLSLYNVHFYIRRDGLFIRHTSFVWLFKKIERLKI